MVTLTFTFHYFDIGLKFDDFDIGLKFDDSHSIYFFKFLAFTTYQLTTNQDYVVLIGIKLNIIYTLPVSVNLPSQFCAA